MSYHQQYILSQNVEWDRLKMKKTGLSSGICLICGAKAKQNVFVSQADWKMGMRECVWDLSFQFTSTKLCLFVGTVLLYQCFSKD